MELNKNIIINNDLQEIPLQRYSTLGPLLTNEYDEYLYFADMPDLESGSDESFEPVFICEYQAREKVKALENIKPLDEIKQNIENKFNFNNVSKSMDSLNTPDILMNRLHESGRELYDVFGDDIKVKR